MPDRPEVTTVENGYSQAPPGGQEPGVTINSENKAKCEEGGEKPEELREYSRE